MRLDSTEETKKIENIEKVYQLVIKFQKLKLGTPNQGGGIQRAELMMMRRIQLCSVTEDGVSKEGVSISRLGELLEISNPAVSQKINILENKKWVERYSKDGDRRKVYVKLTDEGSALLGTESIRILKKLTRLFEGVSEDERNTFLNVLTKMYDNAREENIRENNAKEKNIREENIRENNAKEEDAFKS